MITLAILPVLGLGVLLVGVPSELRPVMSAVTVALVEIKDLLRGNDLDQFNQSGFSECTLCNLSGVDLTRAKLVGAILSGSDLTNANLANANLAVANLTGADLDGVHGADFSGAENVNPKYLKD